MRASTTILHLPPSLSQFVNKYYLLTMDCSVFWPIRLVFVVGSLLVSGYTLWIILHYRLNNREPMRFIVRIAYCQLVMSTCVLAFAIWGWTSLGGEIDPSTHQFIEGSAGLVTAQN